jgi:transcriptional regulator with XRE-family HTH domain
MTTYEQETDINLPETHARKADLIDQHVGKKLRQNRRLLNMSQQDVSELLGISYQQIQKYESGVNRISAGRLYILARIMQIPVQKFYEGLETSRQLGETQSNTDSDNVTDTLQHEIQGLANPDVRLALENLVYAIQGNS